MTEPQVEIKLFSASTPLNDAVLRTLAHLPTRSLGLLVADEFWCRLSDADLMRIAVLLAEKSYLEGGCPIGAIIIDNASRRIVGKGHNTLVQESHPYNHGETAAIRDAGRLDFSQTTLFTSLSPCNICTALLINRGFSRVVVGDVSSAGGNEQTLSNHGVAVKVLEDSKGVALYQQFRREQPELEREDWLGLRQNKD